MTAVQSQQRDIRQGSAEIRRFTAKLAALAVWKEEIDRQIEYAANLQERGCLFPIELDVLDEAVRASCLAAARVVLEEPGRLAA